MSIAIAGYTSSAKSTIIFENPADSSIKGSVPFSEHLSNHGSIFATSEFARLRDTVIPSALSTFAQCRLGCRAQKYTTLFYTSDASPILCRLDSSDYQCNHFGPHSEVAGGSKDVSGRWNSHKFAAYPDALNLVLADAFTFARAGSLSIQPPLNSVADSGEAAVMMPPVAPASGRRAHRAR